MFESKQQELIWNLIDIYLMVKQFDDNGRINGCLKLDMCCSIVIAQM